MHQNKPSILSTRPLTAEQQTAVIAAGISMDELQFIDTIPENDNTIREGVENIIKRNTTVVFTSMNAVEAVAGFIKPKIPQWRIYTVGTATSTLVKQYFGDASLKATASSAAALAEMILQDGDTDEVTFFCSNMRRNELPVILKNHGVTVNEWVVYQTIALPHKLSKKYDGILFFSPSAVDSFFNSNQVAAETVLFAIGHTTAAAVKKYCSNTIITSHLPGKDNLLKKVLLYFSEGTNKHGETAHS